MSEQTKIIYFDLNDANEILRAERDKKDLYAKGWKLKTFTDTTLTFCKEN